MKPACLPLPLPLLLAAWLMTLPLNAVAEPKGPDINYDEAKVGSSPLPDPLLAADGTRVGDVTRWREQRRPEILELFRKHVYGRSPGAPPKVRYQVTSTDTKALGNKATRREVTIWFNGSRSGPHMDLLIYLPNRPDGRTASKVPAFLGLNFKGNHSVNADPAITLSTQWMDKDEGVVEHHSTGKTRGVQSSRWLAEKLVARGYALVTAYYGDLDPDFDDGFKNGVHGPFEAKATAPRAPDAWGAIGAWAWGLSRAMDYLEKESSIDEKRVALLGHSRLGKAALWAGAQDPRFALVISNDSGEGGAALARRWFGETLRRMNTMFPHWFCANFKSFNDDPSKLPVDQHLLLALIAPRPLYVASAVEDRWADPRGEFLGAKNAEPVYRLFGLEGLGVDEMPAVDRPVGKTIGYHIRSGKHDVTEYDWDQYLSFADAHLGQRAKTLH